MDVTEEVRALALRAKAASTALGQASEAKRNEALQAMADDLRAFAPGIVEANAADMDAAREAGTKESLLDRLMLDEARIHDMACALEDLIALPDPLGVVEEERTLYNGLRLQRVSVPLGVVAVVYEARPNVTADAAGISLKSGNACVLRGGSLAARTNEVVADILAGSLERCGLPRDGVCAITTTDRSATDALMSLHGIVDVLIPRGGAGLIAHCVEHAKVPVIETGTGNCHVYLHVSANPQWAHDIVLNAKCRRYGVCNAAETLLVDQQAAPQLLPRIFEDLAANQVLLHTDATASAIAAQLGLREGEQYVAATEDDWATEYLAPELAVRCVSDVHQAIDHINRYGTKHSESIVANDAAALEAFLNEVDAAAVYANASTAFTDGGQFGLGAEIGISTQKLHVRGPFALEALTSYKYVVKGEGQVRA